MLIVSSYDGSVIVNKAVDLNVPAVYVSMNYRRVPCKCLSMSTCSNNDLFRLTGRVPANEIRS